MKNDSFVTACCTATHSNTETSSSFSTAHSSNAPSTPEPPTTAESSSFQNTTWDGKTLKILAIGNSFSVDAMTYLYEIAKAEGVKEVILGNLYIGGCTLQTHYRHMWSGEKAYQYFKNSDGRWVETSNASVLDGILDEDWDIITMQQASGSSGLPQTYSPYLCPMIEFVQKHRTNARYQLAWHMTWAYQQNSTHDEFSNYQKNQMKMYQSICATVQNQVLPQKSFSILIPTGTAIQNARNGFYGDTLTRDGYHLNETARYIAGYTWFSVLTGQPLSKLSLKPDTLAIDPEAEALMIDAINGAVSSPFQVTPMGSRINANRTLAVTLSID